jgi:FAD/FMN-containing dehydrogenase
VFEDGEQAALAALAPFAQSDLATKCLVKMENQPYDFEGLYNRYFSLNDPAGRCARYAVDNVLTNQGGPALHALAQHILDAPTRDCHILASFNMHTRNLPDSCFSWAIDCYVGCYAIWDHEQDDEQIFSWLDKSLPLMDPFAEGHYVNEVEGRRHPDRYRLCYTDENWQRLQGLRGQFDPTGVFHTYLGNS